MTAPAGVTPVQAGTGPDDDAAHADPFHDVPTLQPNEHAPPLVALWK